MNKYEVGQVINSFKHNRQELQFAITNDGAILLAFLKNPNLEEIEQFKMGKSFEIRFTELYKVLMLTVKIGNLNWMDVPYTPHLSKNTTIFPLVNENVGLKLTVMLVDSTTGEIKHIKLLSLAEQFTKQLFEVVMEQKKEEFNLIQYRNSLHKIYTIYSANEIAKMSKEYCKINIS